jgi:hypothetical protein
MFAGASGSGVKDMPSEHSKIMTRKCVECHYWTARMNGDNTPSQKGGHTFRIDERLCLKCHDDISAKLSEWDKKIIPLAAELKGMLDKYPNKNSKAYISAKKKYGMATGDSGMNAKAVHNPAYAQTLLKIGISTLTSDSTWKQEKK